MESIYIPAETPTIRLLRSALAKAHTIVWIVQFPRALENFENFEAILCCLELIGEALNPNTSQHTPIDKKVIDTLCKQIPYGDLVMIRDFLVHRYYNLTKVNLIEGRRIVAINPAIVKALVTSIKRDIPTLIAQLEGTLHYLNNGHQNEEMNAKLQKTFPHGFLPELKAAVAPHVNFGGLDRLITIEYYIDRLSFLLEKDIFNTLNEFGKETRIRAIQHCAEIVGQTINDLQKQINFFTFEMTPRIQAALCAIIMKRGTAAHGRPTVFGIRLADYELFVQDFGLNAYMMQPLIENCINAIFYSSSEIPSIANLPYLNRFHHKDIVDLTILKQTYQSYKQSFADYKLFMESSFNSFKDKFSVNNLTGKSQGELHTILENFETNRAEEINKQFQIPSLSNSSFDRKSMLDMLTSIEGWINSYMKVISNNGIMIDLSLLQAEITIQLAQLNEFNIKSIIETEKPQPSNEETSLLLSFNKIQTKNIEFSKEEYTPATQEASKKEEANEKSTPGTKRKEEEASEPEPALPEEHKTDERSSLPKKPRFS